MQLNKYVFLIVISLLVGCASLTGDSSMDLGKGKNDHRVYEYLTLDNGLRVMLISDPSTDTAAASLDVFVGSGSDPKDREGLAHFLEHMLFLGTEKYPTAGEYQTFISDNAGEHNAYTSFEHTNYYFEVKESALDEALDRFSQFFVAPLLNEELVEREKHAVHSEYQARIKDEYRRYLDALRALINPEHPYIKFSTGSLETLSSSERAIREDLIRFYEAYYSASNMTLVVLGSESLQELRAMVEGRFSAVAAFETPDNTITLPLFKEGALPALLQVEPNMELRQLSFTFPIDDLSEHYKSAPVSVLGHILGHEGKGSLLSFLKANNLAESLSAGHGMTYQGGGIFTVRIGLTEEGLSKQADVITAVFQAIERIRQEGVPQWIFEELKQVSHAEYDFAEAEQPLNLVMSLSSAMHYYPKEDVLSAEYVYGDFDADIIKHVVDQLTINNVLISIVSNEVEAEETSFYYETPYRVAEFDEEFIQDIASLKPHADILLPEPNPFVPESYELVQGGGFDGVPQRLRDESGALLPVWYKGVGEFQIPKSNEFFMFLHPQTARSVEQDVLLELYVDMLVDDLNELVYPAYMAGVGFDLYRHSRGISLKLTGFSDKHEQLLAMLVERIKSFDPEAEDFERIQDQLRLYWGNAEKLPPYKKLLTKLGELMSPVAWSSEDKIQALDQLYRRDVAVFANKYWMQDFYMAALISGNKTEEQAVAMADQAFTMAVRAADEMPGYLYNALPVGMHHVAIQSPHPDNGYVLYLQAEETGSVSEARWQLLSKALASQYYHQLRTEQQLGYIVFAGAYYTAEVPGMVFVVQSPSAEVNKIHQSTVAFLAEMAVSIETLDVELYQVYQEAVIQELLKQPASLYEETSEYWQDLASGELAFDSLEQVADAVRAMTLDEFKAFATQVLTNYEQRSLVLSTEGGLPDLVAPLSEQGLSELLEEKVFLPKM